MFFVTAHPRQLRDTVYVLIFISYKTCCPSLDILVPSIFLNGDPTSSYILKKDEQENNMQYLLMCLSFKFSPMKGQVGVAYCGDNRCLENFLSFWLSMHIFCIWDFFQDFS